VTVCRRVGPIFAHRRFHYITAMEAIAEGGLEQVVPMLKRFINQIAKAARPKSRVS
jgi:hypothetical protein